MADDSEVDLPFPSGGLDVACALAYQPGGTCPVGANVRVADASGGRDRGGQRPGLAKYIPALTAEGAELIQHLNVIADPRDVGLSGYYPDPLTGILGGAEPGNPGEPDPSTNTEYLDEGGDPNVDPSDPLVRNPGRTVRRGGSGVQPTRHRPAGFFHDADANLYLGTVLSGSGETYSVRLDSGDTESVTLLGADASSDLPDGTNLLVVLIDGVYYAQVGLWG